MHDMLYLDASHEINIRNCIARNFEMVVSDELRKVSLIRQINYIFCYCVFIQTIDFMTCPFLNATDYL